MMKEDMKKDITEEVNAILLEVAEVLFKDHTKEEYPIDCLWIMTSFCSLAWEAMAHNHNAAHSCSYDIKDYARRVKNTEDLLDLEPKVFRYLYSKEDYVINSMECSEVMEEYFSKR